MAQHPLILSKLLNTFFLSFSGKIQYNNKGGLNKNKKQKGAHHIMLDHYTILVLFFLHISNIFFLPFRPSMTFTFVLAQAGERERAGIKKVINHSLGIFLIDLLLVFSVFASVSGLWINCPASWQFWKGFVVRKYCQRVKRFFSFWVIF